MRELINGNSDMAILKEVLEKEALAIYDEDIQANRQSYNFV